MKTLDSTLPGFWVIWNPAGGTPSDRHYSEASAIREAERLAGRSPGETFIVLRSACARRCGKLERIDLSKPEEPAD